MDPQTDRITRLEQDLELLNTAGRYNSLGGIQTRKDVDANRAAIALNTATIESFERTIADLQAQIDKLTKEASDG